MTHKANTGIELKVLVADPSGFTNRYLDNSLTAFGYALSITSTVLADITESGVNSFIKPDILIADIGSEGYAGLEYIRQIRLNYPDRMIIIFTNFSHFKYREACLEAGANKFFDKSTEQTELLNTMENELNLLQFKNKSA